MRRMERDVEREEAGEGQARRKAGGGRENERQ